MTDHTPEDHVLPQITRADAGHIVVELDLEQATVLAKVLAHYDAIDVDPPEGYVPEVWHHTLVELFGKVAEVHVPFLRSLRAVDDPHDVEGLARSVGALR